MDSSNLDLNLLRVLDALLRERNVTRSGLRLGLSQPAVSAALAKLRRHYGDELLHRVGNHYELTPLAEALVDHIPPILAEVQRVFEVAPNFEPAVSEREFTLITSDYVAAIFGELLTTTMAAAAPRVRLRFHQASPFELADVLEILRGNDGIILPHGFVGGVPSTNLYEDNWTCVVSRDKGFAGQQLSLSELAEMPWVLTFNQTALSSPPFRQLRLMGVEPLVEVVAESFMAVPFLVAGTDRVALLPESLANRFAELAGVRTLECPWDVVSLTEALWWHPKLKHDGGHLWFRQQLKEVGLELMSRRYQ